MADKSNGHFKLDPKDVEFFRRGKQSIQSLNDQMNGVLQYIVSREGLQTRSVRLSDDCTELTLEE